MFSMEQISENPNLSHSTPRSDGRVKLLKKLSPTQRLILRKIQISSISVSL